jgi:hypothetical protein
VQTSSFYLHIYKVQFSGKPLIVGGKQLPGLCLASISPIIAEKVPLANGVAITYRDRCSLVFTYKIRRTIPATELTCKFDIMLQE